MGNSQSVNLDRLRRKSSTMMVMPTLSDSDMEVIVSQTKMTREEVREYYGKFCTMAHGNNIINKQDFSEIMYKCFPRTYKVDYLIILRYKVYNSRQN